MLASQKYPDRKFANTAQITAEVSEILRPAKKISVVEASERYMRISGTVGSSEPWSVGTAPYMRDPMNTLSSRMKDAVIFVGPARTGKTVGLLDGWVTHTVTCDPSDIMILHMTKDTARDYSKRRIDRLLRNSPELKKRMSNRSSDDNTFDKFFKNGMILTIGWPAVSQLSGKDIRFMAITDLDRMPLDIGGEGDVFGKAQKRTQTFLSRGMTLAESSPGFEIVNPRWEPKDGHEGPPVRGGIFSLYNRGDRQRLYWQCGSCFEWYMPTMDNFYVPDVTDSEDIYEASKQARVFCPHCSTMVDPADRHEINLKSKWLKQGQKIDKQGRIEGAGRESRWASFWMEGPAAAFQSWQELASNKLHAENEFQKTGSEETLKKTTFDDQGRAYLPKSLVSERDPNDLASRGEDLGKCVVPHGVRFLTCGIDVQGGGSSGKARFVVQVIGWGEYQENWLIDRYNLKFSQRLIDPNNPDAGFCSIDPAAYPEDWGVLIDQCINRTYPIDDDTGRVMRVSYVTCDSGGEDGVTDSAYRFFRTLKSKGLHKKFWLVKGASSQNVPRIKLSYPDNTNRASRKASAKGDVPILMLNTVVLKDTISNALNRQEPGTLFMHFPNWLGRWFYEELTAEVRTEKGWNCPAKTSNEAFDLYVYNLVAAVRLGIEKIDWDSPPAWAAEWDDNTEVIDPEDEQESASVLTRKSKRSGRRTRFKY